MSIFGRPKQKSLLTRALAGNLLLVGLSVLILTALFLLAERSALLKQLELRAATLADFVASQCEFPMLVGDRAAQENAARTAMANEDVVFVEIAGRGAVPPVVLRNNRAQGKFLRVTRKVAAPAAGHLMDWEETRAGPDSLGTVSLGLSMQKERALFAQTCRYAAAVAAFALALIAVLHRWQLQRLLRPLNTLASFTREVGSGRLDRKRASSGPTSSASSPWPSTAWWTSCAPPPCRAITWTISSAPWASR